jgi:hypothetical protein
MHAHTPPPAEQQGDGQPENEREIEAHEAQASQRGGGVKKSRSASQATEGHAARVQSSDASPAGEPPLP